MSLGPFIIKHLQSSLRHSKRRTHTDITQALADMIFTRVTHREISRPICIPFTANHLGQLAGSNFSMTSRSLGTLGPLPLQRVCTGSMGSKVMNFRCKTKGTSRKDRVQLTSPKALSTEQPIQSLVPGGPQHGELVVKSFETCKATPKFAAQAWSGIPSFKFSFKSHST